MDNQEISIEKWVNLEDIAEYLSVSKDTIRSWMKENKIPFYRAGKRYKFKTCRYRKSRKTYKKRR